MNKRHPLINELLSLVERIGDPAYQERIWIHALGPECDCFDDTLWYFFSIFRGFTDFEEKCEKYGLSKRQAYLLRELHQQFDQYLDVAPQTDEEVVKDPRWHEVSAFARKIYPELKLDEV